MTLPLRKLVTVLHAINSLCCSIDARLRFVGLLMLRALSVSPTSRRAQCLVQAVGDRCSPPAARNSEINCIWAALGGPALILARERTPDRRGAEQGQTHRGARLGRQRSRPQWDCAGHRWGCATKRDQQHRVGEGAGRRRDARLVRTLRVRAPRPSLSRRRLSGGIDAKLHAAAPRRSTKSKQCVGGLG